MISLNNMNKAIRNLSDRELVNMINTPTENIPEAMTIAEDEIKKRGGIEKLRPKVEEIVKNGIETEKEKEKKAKSEVIWSIIILLITIPLLILGRHSKLITLLVGFAFITLLINMFRSANKR